MMELFQSLTPGMRILDGKYSLQQFLGQGGTATVWTATYHFENSTETKEVVLKFLLPEHAQEEHKKKWFVEEAKIASFLHHPNIVRIFEVEQQTTCPFLVMERCWGKSLEDVLTKLQTNQQIFPWMLACSLVAEVAEALDDAYQQIDPSGNPLHFVHRDLKPGNLIFTCDGTLKVIDFGIAKSSIHEMKTKTGVVKGTISYMSPEQLRAERLDHRSDLFSLSVVLAEMCTGERPFQGDSITALMLSILTHPPHPSLKNSLWIPHEVKRFLEQNLSKDKEERMPNGKYFASQLRAIIEKQQKTYDAGSLFFASLFPEEVSLWKQEMAQATEKTSFSYSSLPFLLNQTEEYTSAATRVTSFHSSEISVKPKESTSSLSPTQKFFCVLLVGLFLGFFSLILLARWTSKPSATSFKAIAVQPLDWIPLQKVRFQITPPCIIYHKQREIGNSDTSTLKRKTGKHSIQCLRVREKLQASFVFEVLTHQPNMLIQKEFPLSRLQIEAHPACLLSSGSRSFGKQASFSLVLPAKEHSFRCQWKHSSRSSRIELKGGFLHRLAFRRKAFSTKTRKKVSFQQLHSLRFSLKPACILSENGKSWGWSNTVQIKRSQGTYRFSCHNPKAFLQKELLVSMPNQDFLFRKTFPNGQLIVFSNHWSHVYVKGFPRRLGVSQKKLLLPEGNYVLRLKHGTDASQKKELQVTIQAGVRKILKVIWKK